VPDDVEQSEVEDDIHGRSNGLHLAVSMAPSLPYVGTVSPHIMGDSSALNAFAPYR